MLKYFFAIYFLSINSLFSQDIININCGKPTKWIENNSINIKDAHYKNENLNVKLTIFDKCYVKDINNLINNNNITSLKIILSDNSLNYLLDSITFYNVRKLDLSNNNFKKLPQNIKYAKSITSIDCSNNKNLIIDKIFFYNLSNLDSLKSLFISGNNISTFSKNFYNKNIEYLDLTGNKLDTLPDMKKSFPNLKYLIISENKFKHNIRYQNISVLN